MLARVDHHLADADLLVGRAGAVQAAEDRVDARDQLADRERLGDVVVGAGVEAPDLVGLLRTRGQHDDRQDWLLGADLLAHREAVHVGQHQVQQHQIRRAILRQLHTLAPEAARHDLEPLELQRVAQAAHQIRLVLDDQHAPGAQRASPIRSRPVRRSFAPRHWQLELHARDIAGRNLGRPLRHHQRRRGHEHRERRATARRALDVDAAAVRLGDVLDQRQADAAAAHVAYARVVGAVEALEDLVRTLGRDPRARDRAPTAPRRPGRATA